MDLANASNWSVIYNQRLTSTPAPPTGRSIYEYYPIQPVTIALASPICIVRIANNLPSEEYQHTACWLKAKLKLAEQDSIVLKRKCALDASTFISIPYFGVLPYTLLLEFHYWLRDLFVSVIQFTEASGRYDQGNQQAVLSAVEVVEQRTAELANTIQLIADRDVVKNYDVNPG